MRKKPLAVTLGMSLLLSMGAAANASAAGIGEERFQPSVTYDLSVTDAERDAIHAEVEALAGRVSSARAGDGTYDPLSLIGAMLDGSSYDSISRGGTAATAYPFPVSNTEANQNEYDRKVAKLAWVVKLATDLGFPVVVQRQPDKYVYAEIGDPDAPEMVMALSHLDSPTASVSPAQLARWRDPYRQPRDSWCLPLALYPGRLGLRGGHAGRQRPDAGDAARGQGAARGGVAPRPTHPHRHGNLRRRRSRHALDDEHRHLPVHPVQLEPELLRQLGLQEPQPGGDPGRGLHLRLAVPGHRRQLRSGDPVGVDELVRGQHQGLPADGCQSRRHPARRRSDAQGHRLRQHHADRLAGNLHPRRGGGRLRRARPIRSGDHRRRDHEGLAPGCSRHHPQGADHDHRRLAHAGDQHRCGDGDADPAVRQERRRVGDVPPLQGTRRTWESRPPTCN